MAPAKRHLRGERQHRQRDDLRQAVNEGKAAWQRQKQKQKTESPLVEPVDNIAQRSGRLIAGRAVRCSGFRRRALQVVENVVENAGCAAHGA